MQQEVVLAMLAKEPSHGYELRARLRDALGPLGDGDERRARLRHADPAGEGGPGGVERRRRRRRPVRIARSTR